MSSAERSGRAESGDDEPADRDVGIQAVVERRDAGTQCTLHPTDAEGVELMSRWMTADEGSFVALTEMR